MLFEIDEEAGDVTISVQNDLYPAEALEGAAHAAAEVADVYIDDEAGDDDTVVTLELKKGPKDAAKLKTLAGDFLNEALSQLLGKARLAENERLTQYIVTKAIMSARRDAADPLQPPAAGDDQLTDEQKAEAASLLKKAEADFAELQKGMDG